MYSKGEDFVFKDFFEAEYCPVLLKNWFIVIFNILIQTQGMWRKNFKV